MRLRATLAPLACLVLALLIPVQAAAQPEARVALVIGNGAYREAPLRNPTNDAGDMAAALRELGFEVILRENASLRQMEEAVDQFWKSLKKGATGLFFFAGHGLQVKGVNYLVPVDARIEVEQDVRGACLDVSRLLGRMENAGNGLNIVVLDACRNNPFARAWRSPHRGLAKMDAPMGTLIAYATAPDSVAADGSGRNGVYTQHMLRQLRTPGLAIENVLKQVRIGVIRETGRQQIPWESTSLVGDFFFVPPGSALASVQTAPAPGQQPAAPLPSPASERRTWKDPVTGMEFVWVPGGEYEMGCGSWAGAGGLFGACLGDEKPVSPVSLDGFWLGKYEVTQAQWAKVMGRNPSYFKMGGDYPVEQVSWDDAKAFIAKLGGMGTAEFRLPTEAEWEYAARSGGKPEKFSGGENAEQVAWCSSSAGLGTHPVGSKAPNGLGLYDMSGNVNEWCEDVKADYTGKARENPTVAEGGSMRVFRGGSWNCDPKDVRTTRRRGALSDVRFRPGLSGTSHNIPRHLRSPALDVVQSDAQDSHLGLRLVRVH